VLDVVPKKTYIESMVTKYRSGVVDNVVAYREVSKMARAEKAGISRREVIPVLIKLAKQKGYSIDQAYEDTVQAAYERRDLVVKLEGITTKLSEYRSGTRLGAEIRSVLVRLRDQIDRLLGR
jgi:hypothetical protein